MKLKDITMFAAFSFSCLAAAQTVDFDTDDFAGVGVYDSWVGSPFNTGLLQGNVKVVDNPYKDDVNPSDKVLALQRSRYGGNVFGAKVTLSEPFDLDNTSPDSPKYVHFYINKPIEGRMAVLLLGNRKEGNPEASQILNVSTTNVPVDTWKDVIVPVYASNGVRITAIVIVPDCESREDLTEDFMTYIDSLEVNKSAVSRSAGKRTDYPLNYDEDAIKTGNTGRHITSVTLSGATSGAQTLTPLAANYSRIYNDMTSSKEFVMMPGETLTPTFALEGNWQNSYIYIDYDQDGKFTPTLNANYTIPAGSEIVTYSYIETVENTSGFNSKGTAVSGGDRNNSVSPAFTIPASMPSGRYRIRFKTDWGSQDPGGSTTSTANNLLQNGGTVVDALVNIHADRQNIILQTRNGDVYSEQNTELGTTLPYAKALKIKLVPALGFKQNGFVLRHGYNLSGDSILHSNKQWSEKLIQASDIAADGTYTIPASLVDGDIMINAEFETLSAIGSALEKNALDVEPVKNGFTIKGENQKFVVTSADGRSLASGIVRGVRIFELPAGIYLVNNKKVLVK